MPGFKSRSNLKGVPSGEVGVGPGGVGVMVGWGLDFLPEGGDNCDAIFFIFYFFCMLTPVPHQK